MIFNKIIKLKNKTNNLVNYFLNNGLEEINKEFLIMFLIFMNNFRIYFIKKLNEKLKNKMLILIKMHKKKCFKNYTTNIKIKILKR
jgi:hypothetical protein